jgi:WD40 repeat protein
MVGSLVLGGLWTSVGSGQLSGSAEPYRLAYWQNESIWSAARGASPKRIVGGLPFERPLASSPDGRILIYWDHEAGHWDLIAVNADGSKPRNLTTDLGGGCRSPAFSPDGRRIAFLSDGPIGLHVMTSDGTGKKRLSELGHRDEPPAWSPDGRLLAWVHLEDSPEIHVVESAGGAPRKVGHGSDPTWTPDGRELIFTRAGSLMLWARQDSGVRMLRQGGTGAKFSPNGKRIAFESRVDPKGITLADWPGLRAVRSIAGAPESYAWSPDSKCLAVAWGDRIEVFDPQGRSLWSVAGGARLFAWVRE